MSLEFSFTGRRGPFLFMADGRLGKETTGVFGPSGAGKTMLLHLIAGIDTPDDGYLRVNGEWLYNRELGIQVPQQKRGIGVVFQEGRLFPHMDVRGNLRFGERLKRASQRTFRFDEILDLLELEPLLAKRPWQLSGGEAQRVALGRALLSSPRLLLLDEPLAALDRGLKIRILPFLRRIEERLHLPMIHVSHDLGELLQLTGSLVVLQAGKVVAQGAFLDLVQDASVLGLIHDLGLLNVVSLKILDRHPEEGIAELAPLPARDGGEAPTWIGPLPATDPDAPLYAALRPEDIALVRRPVEDISIQNQIKCTIRNIMLFRSRALCLVDAGVPLLVEVTPHAIHELHLATGQELHCLFKAQAINYLE